MPTARSNLEALADWLAATAKKIFLEDGEHGATAHIWVKGYPLFVGVTGSEDGKDALRALLEMAARGGADGCGVVTEGWASGGDPESLARAVAWRASGRSLEKLPGRTEMLCIGLASPAGIEHREFEIQRAGSKVRLRKQPPTEPYLNRFLSDLPWPTPPAGVRRRARRAARGRTKTGGSHG